MDSASFWASGSYGGRFMVETLADVVVENGLADGGGLGWLGLRGSVQKPDVKAELRRRLHYLAFAR